LNPKARRGGRARDDEGWTGSSDRRFAIILARDQRDAFIGCVVLGETNRPAPRFPQLIVVGFPLVGDARAAVCYQTREIRMIGKVLARLFERVFNGENPGADASLQDRGNRASCAGHRRPRGGRRRSARPAAIAQEASESGSGDRMPTTGQCELCGERCQAWHRSRIRCASSSGLLRRSSGAKLFGPPT